MRLAVSDIQAGLNVAMTEVLRVTLQRYRVHFLRNVLAHAGKVQRCIVSARTDTAIAQDDAAAIRTR